jgi:maltose O-acetyltransferase
MRVIIRPLFAKCGHNVRFDPSDNFSYGTISIGNNVYIGSGAYFSTKKVIRIGNDVMFGPGVSLLGGNHNTSVIGRFMCNVHEKRPDDDLDIVIDNDVWVGARATILKGVTVGRGAIVAAGAVVTQDVAPYSIVGGVPARRLRYRWTAEEIREHEKTLYEPADRLSGTELPPGREEVADDQPPVRNAGI